MEKNLGHATAYGYAKSKGYTGTEEEFGVLMASYASVAQDASQSASSAAESAQLASNEAQRASQSATSAHNDAETASNIKTDVESARDTTVDAKNATVEAKNISVEAKNSAISAKDTAESKAQIAEAWAVGQKDGTDVPSTDETYHNNAKYYSEQADIAKIGAESAQQLAQASATSASESASDASTSAQTASQAAQTATSKASEATTAATTATTKASEASTSAGTASTAAQTATNKASEATTAATTATTKASEANQSATSASTAKINAETARDAAVQSASEAANSAIEAAQSAQSVDAERLNRVAFGSYVTESASGAIASFPDGADSIPMKDVLVHIEPVQEGSGDPSPDNVRPITGWTGAKVTRTGKNLLNPKLASGTYTGNGITWTLNNDGSVTVSGTATGISYLWMYGSASTPIPSWMYKLAGKTVTASSGNGHFTQSGYASIQVILYGSPTLVIGEETATIPSDLSPYTGFAIVLWINTGNMVDATVYPQFELGSTATDYEPYSGQTYDITFPTEAGTVYGGTLDVTKGELVVDRAMVDLGTLTWVWNVTNGWVASFPGIKQMINNNYSMDAICSTMPVVSKAESAAIVSAGTNEDTIAATWQGTYLYGTNANAHPTGILCYALATPITYQLTPQEITSLLGENNLWADTGDSEVEYRVDPALLLDDELSEVQSMIAGVESSTVATKNYSIGDLVIVGGILYEVTAAIASGETISASNAVVTTVDNVIKSRMTTVDNTIRNRIADSIDDTLTVSGKAADAKVTGDGITGLKSAFNVAMDGISVQGAEITGDIIAFDKTRKTITQIAISDTSATSATITRCGKNIYPKYNSGSGNGLSWEVASDGTITFTGTPSADTMLRLYNVNIPTKIGEKKTVAFFNNMYDSNNRLSFFGVTASGNWQVNLNSTNKTNTSNHSVDTPITELRFRIPKDIDWTGLVIKPMMIVGGVAGEFEEYNGQTYNVTVSDGVVHGDSITYLDGVNTMWSSVGDITLTFDQAKNIKEYVDEQFANASLFPSFYKYVQRTYSIGTQKYLYVYNKSGNKVVQWTLMNTPASSSNSDTWQIGGVKGYDFDGNTLSNEIELAMNGEFELSIKEHGAADYCGGVNHGDENTDVFKLFIDGKQISDLTTLDENYHAFERIDAFEIATINRCNTPSEDIITHQKIWTFENGKVRVHQTCKFLEQIQVDVMMVCMFKAVRLVYPYGIRQGGVEIEEMTDASFTKKYTTGNDAYYLYYGDDATAKIHAKTDNDGSIRQSMLWIDNGSSFNKLYLGYWGYNNSANPVTVPEDTIVTEETEYDVAFD